MSSTTHGSWTSSYGKTRQSAASLAVSRATRIFAVLLNDVPVAADNQPAKLERAERVGGRRGVTSVAVELYVQFADVSEPIIDEGRIV